MKKNTLLYFILLLVPIYFLVTKITPLMQRSLETSSTMQIEKIAAQKSLDSLVSIKNKSSYQLNRIEYYKKRVAFYNRMGAQTSTHVYSMLSMVIILVLGFSILFLFKKKTSKRLSLSKRQANYNDFSDYNLDSIGQQISWEPNYNGGANFMISELIQVNPNLIKIKSTNAFKMFIWLFLLLAINFTFFELYELYLQGKLFNLSFIELLKSIPIVSVVLFTVSIATYFSFSSKSTFNKDTQLFKNTSFKDIYAIQLLSKSIKGKNHIGYVTYELNLVLTNGNRVYIMDNNNRSIIESDAVLLGKFLAIPIWKL